MKTKSNETFAKEVALVNPNTILLGKYIKSNIKVRCKCKTCGNEWDAFPSNLLKGRSCDICARKNNGISLRNTQDEFLTKVQKNNPHIEIIGKYINNKSPIKCRCKVCGNEWIATQSANLYKHSPCPKCKGLISDHSEFVNKLNEINSDIVPLSKYRIKNEAVRFKCKKCDYEWETLPSLVLKGSGCPRCAGVLKLTQEEFLERLDKNIIPLGEYINNSTRIEFQCRRCNYIWKATPASIFRGTGCPKCAGTIKKSNEVFLNELNEINPNIVPLEDYKNNKSKIKCQCKKCGYIWKTLPINVLRGSGCPNCNRRLRTSLPEQAVFYYIKKIYPEAYNSYKEGFGQMELDVFIPERKIGIEYDGYQWHKDKNNKEKKKYYICKKEGIFLIRIREDNLSEDELNEICDYYIHSDYEDTSHTLSSVNNCIERLFNYLEIPADINVDRDRFEIEELYSEKGRKNSVAEASPEIVKEWYQKENGSITPDMVNCGSNKIYSWKCSKCGYVWKATPYNRCKNKSNCPSCANRLRLSNDQFIEKVNNPNIIFLNEYYNNRSRMQCKCKKCGYEWETSAADLMSGKGCPKCAGNLKLTNEEFIKRLQNHNPNIICQEDYKGIDTKILFKCKRCGYEWETSPYNLFKSKPGKGCPNCSKTRKKTNEDLISMLNTLHPNVVPLEDYIGANIKIRFKCKTCGHEWYTSPHSLELMKKSNGCPLCREREKGI